MSRKKKYIGLTPNTPEYNKAQWICLKNKITFDEYLKDPDKYRIAGKQHPYEKGSKDYFKSAYVKHKYGITLEDVNNMFSNQEFKCAICGKELHELSKAHIDHCHSSGKVRGILCRLCNMGLGSFKDDKESLRNAINYLEKSE